MTVWNKSVSWSKFKAALDCPLSLQKIIEKEKYFSFRPNMHQTMGKVVQKVYELYFNHELNLRKGGRAPEVPRKILQKVKESSWFKGENLLLPMDVTEDKFWEEVEIVTDQAFGYLSGMGLMNHKVKSEVKFPGIFDGFRMFGMLDFLVEVESGVFLYDGKGHKEENADKRQLLYYALALHGSGRNVRGGGFIYWRHGPRPVDLSPKALKDFAEGDLAKGREIFQRLRTGVSMLEATPSKEKCYFCNYKITCSESVFRKELNGEFGMGEVGMKHE